MSCGRIGLQGAGSSSRRSRDIAPTHCYLQRTVWLPASRRRQFDPDCPFCPGHENRLPGIASTETRTQSSASVGPYASSPTSSLLCSQTPRPRLPRSPHGIACATRMLGLHEVIIESPRHDADLVSMTDAQIEAVVSAYRDRLKHLLNRPGIEAVVLFRNHGPWGGASLPHPHAQALALGLVPPTLALLAHWGHRYYLDHGCCPTCDEIAGERDLGSRIVEETQNFLVLVPFAPEHPCETWIVPIEHQASFLHMDDVQRAEFARLLRSTLDRLLCAKDDPPYNFVIDSAARIASAIPVSALALEDQRPVSCWRPGADLNWARGWRLTHQIRKTMPPCSATGSEALHENRHFRGGIRWDAGFEGAGRSNRRIVAASHDLQALSGASAVASELFAEVLLTVKSWPILTGSDALTPTTGNGLRCVPIENRQRTNQRFAASKAILERSAATIGLTRPAHCIWLDCKGRRRTVTF